MIETTLYVLAAVGVVALVWLPIAGILDWWAMRRGPGPQPWDGEEEKP